MEHQALTERIIGAAIAMHRRFARRATVAAEAGLPESTLSEVLSGRRRLDTRHIGILAHYFRIEPGIFIDAPEF